MKRPIVIFRILFLTSLTLAGEVYSENNNHPESESLILSLDVYVDDVESVFNIDADWIRENYLQSAAYEAFEDSKVFRIDEWNFNKSIPEDARNTLELRVNRWRQSRSGFYEFSGAAFYYDAQGTRMSLGGVNGTKPGIGTFTHFDRRDNYVDVATDAFERALKRIQKLPAESTD